MKLGKLEIDLNELIEFIVEAKKNCYAGNGEEQRLEDGSRLLTFQEGNFHYEDNYDGYYQAPGREIVRWQQPNGQRIWQMSYSGGMIPKFIGDEELTKKTFEFLKKALSNVTEDMPFRGPSRYDNDKFSYTNSLFIGDEYIEKFLGREEIFSMEKNIIVFEQDYIGGLIIPK